MPRAYRSRSPVASGLWAALLLVACLQSPATAQDLAAELALDPAVRSGRLDNGLTYFIRPNARPARRVLLRLAVKAGSVDEADDQRGLAHMLEHMAFNGSAHFAPGELVTYLESVGSRFGPHVNAYTSFDETVYMLDLPADRAEAVTRGVEALSDFAYGATLAEAEIDRERGVVIEEWRGRLGAGARLQGAQMAALFGDSRYSDRIPIGTPESLRTFTPERLRDFYRDHYRADRMAVIVVGDVDPDTMERLVRTHFSGAPGPGPTARPVFDLPSHRETRVASLGDPEVQGTSIAVVHKRPLRPLRTLQDYRAALVQSLVQQMFNDRFAEIARRPDAPFIGAGAGMQTLGRTVEAFTMSARVEDGGAGRGLSALAEELARARTHGFGDAELDRARRALLASYERSFNERDTTESEGLASELVRYYLTGEAAPGIAAEYDLARRFLPTVTPAETAGLLQDLTHDDNRVVLATAPEKDGTPVVSPEQLSQALARGASLPVQPWADSTAGRSLMAVLPDAGSVRASREIPDLGVTILTLSNGAEVWLKPTDFKNDQVVFTSYARGGTSLAPEADYTDASLSTGLVAMAGVGGLSPTDLDRLLAGRIANVSAYMGQSTHGVSGSSTPRDLETALQLLHLHFTAPNRTPASFDLLKRRLSAALANQSENPGAVFGERVRLLNTGEHFTARATRAEDLAGLRLDRMAAYYDARFGNAADFTFFFVGAFTVDEITPLLTRYIGSLPSRGRATTSLGEVRLQFPTGITRETVRKGREPRSQTVVSFFADPGLDELAMHRVRAAASVLEARLRDLLREELGGTYSVGVGFSSNQPQPGYGLTTVQFGSAPDTAGRLTAAVLDAVERLQQDGPTAAEIDRVRETELRELETSERQNNYWLNSLQTLHLFDWDPRRILARHARAEALTPQNVLEALRAYFPLDRYTVVTLVPDTM
ncbi:MAG: M16 family metallopeptidase [Vicinamibacterales bacterium]